MTQITPPKLNYKSQEDYSNANTQKQLENAERMNNYSNVQGGGSDMCKGANISPPGGSSQNQINATKQMFEQLCQAKADAQLDINPQKAGKRKKRKSRKSRKSKKSRKSRKSKKSRKYKKSKKSKKYKKSRKRKLRR